MTRYKKTKIASIIGILVNIFLLIIKSIIGFITKSQSMIADSFVSAGDCFSSLMTFIGNKIASKPSDNNHNFGYGKAEYIFSMMISISMIITSLFILKDSILVIINKEKYIFSIWLIIVCITAIIFKLILYIYTNYLYKKYHSLLIKANSKDHLSDAIITSTNLISCILSIYGYYYLDGVVGVLISIWILYISIKIFIESYNILIDKAIPNKVKNKVLKIIKRDPNIIKVINFNSLPLGYKYQITFTVLVDGNLSTFDSYHIISRLEEEITNTIDEIYITIVRINPK